MMFLLLALLVGEVSYRHKAFRTWCMMIRSMVRESRLLISG